MIYDCFTFYNELDILEIRLNILNNVVDKFVLVESLVTHTNKEKPLYFTQNKNRFKEFNEKIIHVVVDDCPNVSHPWIIEHFLMTAVERGLKRAKPNDTILISNVDEIPNPIKIKEHIEKAGTITAFEQQLCYYFLNLGCVNRKWLGTKMLLYKDFLTYNDAYVIRHSPYTSKIPDGGWHFSYMGGTKMIRQKMSTGSHQEYNNNRYNTEEKILQKILLKKDLFGHGNKFDVIPLTMLPLHIQKNRIRYSSMFLSSQKKPFQDQYISFLAVKHFLRVLYRFLREKAKAVIPFMK